MRNSSPGYPAPSVPHVSEIGAKINTIHVIKLKSIKVFVVFWLNLNKIKLQIKNVPPHALIQSVNAWWTKPELLLVCFCFQEGEYIRVEPRLRSKNRRRIIGYNTIPFLKLLYSYNKVKHLNYSHTPIFTQSVNAWPLVDKTRTAGKRIDTGWTSVRFINRKLYAHTICIVIYVILIYINIGSNSIHAFKVARRTVNNDPLTEEF